MGNLNTIMVKSVRHKQLFRASSCVLLAFYARTPDAGTQQAFTALSAIAVPVSESMAICSCSIIMVTDIYFFSACLRSAKGLIRSPCNSMQYSTCTIMYMLDSQTSKNFSARASLSVFTAGKPHSALRCEMLLHALLRSRDPAIITATVSRILHASPQSIRYRTASGLPSYQRLLQAQWVNVGCT